MAGRRKGKGKAIPGIEESFLATPSDGHVKVINSKTRKRKPRATDCKSSAKGSVPLRFTKRATSDPVLMQSTEGNAANLSNVKIDAFNFFQQMLNICCGSEVFDVFSTASILKQFTPDVMKTVIYVMAENSKRATPKVLTEAQTQTQAQEKFEEHQDLEISSITSKARRKRRSKWQPVPDLVQPRLTSPVSNSCSPVSAAVQALMSFARNDDQLKVKRGPAGDSSEQKMDESDEKDRHEDDSANLNVFESGSLTQVSSSPFLQPMSSSLMLNSEVKKPKAFPEAIASEKESKSASGSPQSTNINPFGRSASPSFPWIKMSNKSEPLIKSENSKSCEKYLPSISSILAPIGSTFSDLNFQSMSVLNVSTNSSSSMMSSTSTEQHRNSLPPMDLIMPGLRTSTAAERKARDLSVLTSQAPVSMKARKPSGSSSSLLVSTSSSENTVIDSSLKLSPKTVFRKILPKPNRRKKSGDTSAPYLVDSQSGAKDGEHKLLLDRGPRDLNGGDLKLQSEIGFLMPDSPPVRESLRDGHASVQKSAASDEPLISVGKEKSKESGLIGKPLANVISSMRQQGLVIKGLPDEPLASGGFKTKRSTHSNSGKLEVASALLSMGSTENETNASGKVVSTFNKEKSTFDIKESSSVQRGDILFTKTGTFQIEDIEIDPKKNKIEKDSYECGKCGRVFTSLVYLARHIKRVCPDMTLRKWKCERCDKAFRHPFGLQQHIFTHTGERPFKCDQCSKAFYSANDLRRHIRTHSGERPYVCSHCQKCFSTTISLKTHTYIHTGERPHKCPHCPKTFATSSKLSRHVVTHSDKRPFACNICVKTFNRSGDLRRHYNSVHNLEHGLLNCDQCNKLFATEKCLDNHKRTHNRHIRIRESSEGPQETSDVKFSQLVPGNYTIKPAMEE